MSEKEREVTTQGARPPVLLSVQALRGLAALLVLMFHIYEMQRFFLIEHPDTPAALAGPLLTGFWAQGYVGVDLFFLISGFIMVYITAHQPSGWRTARQFIWSRFTRIYPLWFLFCTILAVHYFVWPGVPVDETIPGYDGNYPLYLIKSLLLIPQSAPPILRLGWTLIHEMFFYFGFTVLLLLPKKFRYVALPFWGVLTVGLFALGFSRPSVDGYPALAASLLTLEFLAGAGIGWLTIKARFIAPLPCLILGGIAAFLAMFTYQDRGADLLLWGRVAVYTLPYALLLYGAMGLEKVWNWQPPRPAKLLGDWSYSLYLSHLLVLGVLIRTFPVIAARTPDSVAQFFDLGQAGIIDNLTFILTSFVASLIVAVFFFYAFERPLIRYLRRKRRN